MKLGQCYLMDGIPAQLHVAYSNIHDMANKLQVMHYRLWSQPFRSQVVRGLVERYRRYGSESPIRKAA